MAQETDHIGDTNKMITAVEWLQNTWFNYPDLCTYEKIQEWFEQAKAMEKEQIINAACYEPFLGDFPRKEGEHYYNKTYNK
jgi:hypothetical protein